MAEALIVSSSGIRGVVGTALVPEVAARYGAAFGTFLTRTRADAGEESAGARVLLGRDSRTSGPVLADAAAAGLRSAGLHVRDLGVVATPTALLAAEEDPAALGVLLITASHNPVEWNGLKLAGADGRFLSGEAGRAVQRWYEEGPIHRAWNGLGGRDALTGAVERHVERILELPLLDPQAIAGRGFLVALDCVRGAGGPVMQMLLERLGCRIIELHLEPDGRFPRPPEPLPEHLGELGEAVRREGADLGMAVDPDGDRLALVEERGRPVGEDWTLALAVELVLSKRAGPVVTNLSSGGCIRDAAGRAGQPFHRAPVGEANVARRMDEVGAVVGGEGNGGVMLPALHTTRDAPLAAALVLQLLADADTSLGELIARFPEYHLVKDRLPRPAGPVAPLLDALAGAAEPGAEEDRQDGLRLEWPDGRWLHVRPSGTEPILRIVAEAPERAEASRLTTWARELVGAAGAGGG